MYRLRTQLVSGLIQGSTCLFTFELPLLHQWIHALNGSPLTSLPSQHQSNCCKRPFDRSGIYCTCRVICVHSAQLGVSLVCGSAGNEERCGSSLSDHCVDLCLVAAASSHLSNATVRVDVVQVCLRVRPTPTMCVCMDCLTFREVRIELS
jgi:hypothetical protein